MLRKVFLPLVYIVGLVAVLVFTAANQQPSPEALPVRTSLMSLPPDYRQTYVHYLTVDRADGTVRRLYIEPEALVNLQAGEPLPVGTQIIIEAYDAQRNLLGGWQTDVRGQLVPGAMFPTIHAAEKRADWPREAIAASTRLGQWNFETFDSLTFQPADENRADCFTCHDASAFRRDFIFTRPQIDAYVQHPETQYFFCNRGGRAPCG